MGGMRTRNVCAFVRVQWKILCLTFLGTFLLPSIGGFGKEVSATPIRNFRGYSGDEKYAMNPQSLSFIAQRGGLRRNRERKSGDAKISDADVPIASGVVNNRESMGEKIKSIRHGTQDSTNLSRFRQKMKASQEVSVHASAPSDFLGLGGKGTHTLLFCFAHSLPFAAVATLTC